MAGRRIFLAFLGLGLLLVFGCTPSPEKLMADAEKAFESGQMRAAEIHLKNLLQQRPDAAAARLLLGKVTLASGDFAGSEQSLRRALELGADPAAAQLSLVRALLAQRKYKETLEQIAKGPKPTDSADQVAALVLEASAQRGLRDLGRAEAAYRAGLALDPSSPALRSELASVLLETGRADDAQQLIAALLAEQPRFVPALLLRGRLESSSRQFAAAESTFQQAADLARGDASQRPSYVLALAQLVEAQLALNKVDAAAANADALLALDARSPIARYMKAAVEFQQKDLEGAERRLEGVIADAPQYWPAHRLLGAINVAQDQTGQAVMYLRSAVNNDPSDDAARLQLAELYIRQGDVGAARELLEASPSGADVSDALFLAFVGRASQQAGLAEQAAKYFDQSERTAPENVQQLVGMSRMYVAAGEFERAVRVLEGSSFDDAQSERLRDYLLALVQVRQGNLQAADATARRLAEVQPDAAWPLSLGGAIAMAGSDWPRARELLTRAVELEPKNAGALLNLARVAAAQNNATEAEQYLKRVLAISPSDTTARIGLAQLAANRRDFAAAEEQLEGLPPSPLHDRLLGELRAVQGRFDDAATEFAHAYSAQPSGELALRIYGAASRAGRADADAQLRAWTAANPRDPGPNFALGSIAIEKNDLDEAVRRYEAVLAASPSHAPTMNNLAWLYSQRNDPRALDLAARAHAIDPNNPSIADTLGWLHVQHGAAAEGLPLLAQAAEGLPNQAEVRYHWGVALAESGDGAKALEVLKGSLVSGGEFSGRDDAAKRVAALEANRP